MTHEEFVKELGSCVGPSFYSRQTPGALWLIQLYTPRRRSQSRIRVTFRFFCLIIGAQIPISSDERVKIVLLKPKELPLVAVDGTKTSWGRSGVNVWKGSYGSEGDLGRRMFLRSDSL